jgi:cytochrome P450
MPFISRVSGANLPWLHYLTVVAVLLFLPAHQAREWLWVNALAAFLCDTEFLLKAFQDPLEPPLIPHPYLPFIGHVVGLFWHGGRYWEMVNQATQYPIFTLQTLQGRTIGIISPQFAAPVQRASKNRSFYSMIFEVSRRLVEWDDASMKIITWNMNGELGHRRGVVHESHDHVESMLAPGPNLHQLSSFQLETFATMLNELVPRSTELSTTLMEVMKHVFTLSNALTIYGPRNPFALHPELVQRFWDYEAGMVGIMADVLPWITARKSWKARRDVNNALEEYLEKDHYRQASPFIQHRVAINLKHGISKKYAAHFELILLFGILGNAVPTTFWLLSNIFSRPDLLVKIREETSRAILCTDPSSSSSSSSSGHKKQKTINVTKLKTECPLLVSIHRETLREIANLASVRLVMNTHPITAPGHRTYLLKKGSMIQIASGVIHFSESVWGPDAKSFKPERFVSTSGKPAPEQSSAEKKNTAHGTNAPSESIAATTTLPKNVPSSAYRAFGGGSNICPGRHFALSEIVGFAALFVNMFDVVDANGGGTMPLPVRDDSRVPLSVMKPVSEPRVVIKRREGEEDVHWKLEL